MAGTGHGGPTLFPTRTHSQQQPATDLPSLVQTAESQGGEIDQELVSQNVCASTFVHLMQQEQEHPHVTIDFFLS